MDYGMIRARVLQATRNACWLRLAFSWVDEGPKGPLYDRRGFKIHTRLWGG